MPPNQTLTLKAHAKLNLALAVGPAQPPRGYHPIESLFVAIDLHDTLTLSRLPDGASSRYDIRWAPDAPRPTPIDWAVEKDLGVRAHQLLEQRIGRALPVALTLDKRTPVGGGLGGGSSDAAFTLMGLNHLFELGLLRDELAEVSSGLGSDIAFFLDAPTATLPARVRDAALLPRAPRPAIVSGFGERIERLPGGEPEPILLLIPPFGCPTGAVYEAFEAMDPRPLDMERVMRVRALTLGFQPDEFFNDLAAPACVVEPRLRSILDKLGSLSPNQAHLSGSGSTLFVAPGRAISPRDLDAIEARIRTLCPELAVVRTHTL